MGNLLRSHSSTKDRLQEKPQALEVMSLLGTVFLQRLDRQ